MSKQQQHLKELTEMAKKSSDELNNAINIFGSSMDELIKELPDEEKGEVERVKGLMQRVINMSKNGRVSDAQDLIKNFSYGRKGSEKGV